MQVLSTFYFHTTTEEVLEITQSHSSHQAITPQKINTNLQSSVFLQCKRFRLYLALLTSKETNHAHSEGHIVKASHFLYSMMESAA